MNIEVDRDPPIFPGTTSGLRLGLGGAGLGNLYQAISDDDARALLRAALADGCRTFDTAPHYGNGLSERRVGAALREAPRDDVVLSTKVGRLLVPGANAARNQHGYVDVLPFEQRWDYSAAGVRRSIEDSLQRLGVARIAVAFIHDCDAVTHGARYPDVLGQVVTQAIPELERARSEGLIGHIGLGVNDVDVCLDVLARTRVDCLLLAGRYSLIDQSALPQLLPMCVRHGVRIALGGVFNSGILATGVRAVDAPLRFNYAAAPQAWIERTAALEDICERCAVPLRAAALQFPLAHPAIDVVIAGAQLARHWADTVRMLTHPIPPEFWARLKAQRLLAETAPTPG
jgi:D-threo-aldose 1-dehydrogenase